ncbi:MAG: hypothetical protein GEV08_09600 [Acidimicrobiia bacterium]|nr:hypothetical protein [Acidimicrobiia bacterium]
MRRSFDARWRALGGLLALVLGTLLWAAPQAGAAEPDAIRDYAAYPLGLGLIPPTCQAQGADVLTNVRFSVNGGPEVASLRASSMQIGDSLTMRWDGFAPGCEGTGIGLSIKAATDVRFDPDTNQYASHQAYCGPAGTPCAAPYTLTLSLTPAAPTPCFQVDAHIGPMLSVVGPDGAYYNFGSSYNMLIDAYNGGAAPCEPAPCPEHPELPMGSVECQITAQGVPPAPEPPPATTTPQPPVTAAAPPVTSSPTTTPATSSGDDSAQGARRTSVLGAQTTLPATGSTVPVGNVALAGLLLLQLGVAAVLVTTRRRAGSSGADG